MGQRIKVRFDRQYRGMCELLDEATLKAKVLGVPHGGPFNAEDTVILRYDTRKDNVTVERTRKNPETGETETYQALEERDTNERHGDPYVHDLVTRVWPRRTYVKTRGDAGPLVEAIKRKYWPVERLEGVPNELVVAHPVKTDIRRLADEVKVKLLECSLEQQEAEE